MIHFTEEPTLKDYLAAVRRRAWVVAAVLALALVAGLMSAFMTTPKYRAESSVLVDTSTWNTRDYVERAEVPEVARVLELLRSKVLTRESLAAIANRLDLYPEAGGDPAKLASAAAGSVSTEVTGFDSFTVRFVHADAAKASAAANAIAEAFVEEQRTQREAHGEKTTSVMSQELAAMAKKLAEQNDAIKQFRIRSQGSLPGQTEGNLRAIERWQGDLRLNTNEMQRAKQRLELALASTPKLWQGEAIEALRAEVSGLQAERKQLEDMIRGAEAKVAKAAEVEGVLAVMNREYDSMLRSYNDMLERRQAAGLRVELDRSRFDAMVRVVEPAKVPTGPFKPARVLIMALALALGLLGGAALAIAIDWFDDTFHDAPALARVTGLPVVAVLPRQRKLLGQPARP